MTSRLGFGLLYVVLYVGGSYCSRDEITVGIIYVIGVL